MSETFPSIIAQSWPWDSQIAVKKNTRSNQIIIPYLGCLLLASSLLTDAEMNENVVINL